MSILDFRVTDSNSNEASCTNAWKWLYNLETTIYSNLQMWDNMVLWFVSETNIFMCFENMFVDIFLWLAIFYIKESFFSLILEDTQYQLQQQSFTLLLNFQMIRNLIKVHHILISLACHCLFEFILNLFVWCGTCWYFQVNLDEQKLLNHFNYINK